MSICFNFKLFFTVILTPLFSEVVVFMAFGETIPLTPTIVFCFFFLKVKESNVVAGRLRLLAGTAGTSGEKCHFLHDL